MSFIPYPFQRTAVRSLKRMGFAALLAMEQGTGKTCVSLMCVEGMPKARPVIVVCPATVKHHWQAEASKHFGMTSQILNGTVPPKRVKGLSQADLLILNYDILSPRRRHGKKTAPGWLDFLVALNPQFVILDEVHMISDSGTSRSRGCQKLCRNAPHVLGLSGTPLTNRPKDLWMPLHVICPELFPNRFAYNMTYCAAKRTFYGWNFNGASNLEDLNAKLGKVMVRFRREDVLKQLPKKRRVVLPLELPNRKEYEEAEGDFAGWALANLGATQARKTLKAEQLTKLSHLKHLAAVLKLPSVFSWIEDFLAAGESKLIVFAIHRDVVDALHKRFPRSVTLTGGTPKNERPKRIKQFLKSPKVDLLIGNIKAAGVGWSATNVGATCFVEFPWAPGDLSQAEDRTSGICRGIEGQSSLNYYLVAQGTLETYLVELLTRKQRNISAVLDGGSREGDLNLQELLTQKLLEERSK